MGTGAGAGAGAAASATGSGAGGGAEETRKSSPPSDSPKSESAVGSDDSAGGGAASSAGFSGSGGGAGFSAFFFGAGGGGSSSLRSSSLRARTSSEIESALNPTWFISRLRASCSNRMCKNRHSSAASASPHESIFASQKPFSVPAVTAWSSSSALPRNSGSVTILCTLTAGLDAGASAGGLLKVTSCPPNPKAAPAGRLSHPGAWTAPPA
mmetsp:Transcript_50253/g.120400  ORF Transcript_50253/g.120400 Transcript_50253/m.120400 type:complete len:211 (-) Transcript_50253:1085-1717(-)